jgi:hypothetical protein
MPYVIQVSHSKVDNSDKPIRERDNYPENIKELNELYRKTFIRPVFKENNGVFKRKVIGNNLVITEYIFETEEQARNFYSVLTDDTNPLKNELFQMILELPSRNFAQTEKTMVLKGPNGEILIP